MGKTILVSGMEDGGASMLDGAVAGMKASLEGAEATEAVTATWAGEEGYRVDVTSPGVNLVVYFLHLEDSLFLFAVGAPPSKFGDEAVASTLQEWAESLEKTPG